MMPLILKKSHSATFKNLFKKSFCLKPFTVLVLTNNLLLGKSSYFKINGIMCCIVLKSYYLCYVIGKIDGWKQQNPESAAKPQNLEFHKV